MCLLVCNCSLCGYTQHIMFIMFIMFTYNIFCTGSQHWWACALSGSLASLPNKYHHHSVHNKTVGVEFCATLFSVFYDISCTSPVLTFVCCTMIFFTKYDLFVAYTPLMLNVCCKCITPFSLFYDILLSVHLQSVIIEFWPCKLQLLTFVPAFSVLHFPALSSF